MLIDDAKPSPIKSLPDGLKILADETRFGKINRKFVKALFKVAVDDIEYEISARTDYLDYLKSEIKRVKEALNYYNKMEATSSKRKKEYYKNGVEACLRRNETVEVVPEMYEQLVKSLSERKAHIEKLYTEAKQIKRLVV